MPGSSRGSPPSARSGKCGVGLVLEQNGFGNPVIVTQILPGGPCDKGQKSTVKPQDRLLSIDNVPVSQMKGGELRTLIEGREGTPVKLGLERRDGPDMFGNRRLRRMDVTIYRGFARSNLLKPFADGIEINSTSPLRTPPKVPLPSTQEHVDQAALSPDPDCNNRNDREFQLRKAYNNTPDAERSESPGGAYIYPGASKALSRSPARRSPATSSLLSSVQIKLDNGDSVAPGLLQGSRGQGPMTTVVLNGPLEDGALLYGRSVIGKEGEAGGDELGRALESLLKCAQLGRVPLDSECPCLAHQEGGRRYNEIISSLFHEFQKLKQHISVIEMDTEAANAAVNNSVGTRAEPTAMPVQERTQSHPPRAIGKPPTSPSAPHPGHVESWSSVQVESSLQSTLAGDVLAGSDVLKSTLAFQSPLTSPDKTPFASPAPPGRILPDMSEPEPEHMAKDASSPQRETHSSDPSNGRQLGSFELGSMHDQMKMAADPKKSGPMDILSSDIFDADTAVASGGGNGNANVQQKVDQAIADSCPLIAGGTEEGAESRVQIFVNDQSVHDKSQAVSILAEGAHREKRSVQMQDSEDATRIEPSTGRLTPAGHIFNLIKTYERGAIVSGGAPSPSIGTGRKGGLGPNATAKEDHRSGVTAPVSPQIVVADKTDSSIPDPIPTAGKAMPKVLQALPTPPLLTSQSGETESIAGAVGSRGAIKELAPPEGGLVRERREKVELLIKRSRELAQETSWNISKDDSRAHTGETAPSASMYSSPHSTEAPASTISSIVAAPSSTFADGSAQNISRTAETSSVGSIHRPGYIPTKAHLDPSSEDKSRHLSSRRSTMQNILEPSNATKEVISNVTGARHSWSSPQPSTAKHSTSIVRAAPPALETAFDLQSDTELTTPEGISSSQGERAKQAGSERHGSYASPTGTSTAAKTIVSITPRSLATSASLHATSIPLKPREQIPLKQGAVKTAVKSIDELRARHAQFKDKDIIPPSPVVGVGPTAAAAGVQPAADPVKPGARLQPRVPWLQSGPFSNSPRMVGGGRRGNDDPVDALQSAGEQERAKAKWASHPFGAETRSSGYLDGPAAISSTEGACDSVSSQIDKRVESGSLETASESAGQCPTSPSTPSARQRSIASAITAATLQSASQFRDDRPAPHAKSFFARQAEKASPQAPMDAEKLMPHTAGSNGEKNAAEKGMEIFQSYRVKERSLMERALAHQAVANLQFQYAVAAQEGAQEEDSKARRSDSRRDPAASAARYRTDSSLDDPMHIPSLHSLSRSAPSATHDAPHRSENNFEYLSVLRAMETGEGGAVGSQGRPSALQPWQQKHMDYSRAQPGGASGQSSVRNQSLAPSAPTQANSNGQAPSISYNGTSKGGSPPSRHPRSINVREQSSSITQKFSQAGASVRSSNDSAYYAKQYSILRDPSSSITQRSPPPSMPQQASQRAARAHQSGGEFELVSVKHVTAESCVMSAKPRSWGQPVTWA